MDWDEFEDADYLLREIYEAIRQLAGALYEIACPLGTGCSYSSPSDLFQKVFTSIYKDGLTFMLKSGFANPAGDAAMYTEAQIGKITIGNSGRGMANYEDERDLIERYLITHELLHILSLRTGGVADLTSSSGLTQFLYYFGDEDQQRLVGSLEAISNPFYIKESDGVNLPSGLNNFGYIGLEQQFDRWRILYKIPTQDRTTQEKDEFGFLSSQFEETGVELLNLLIWEGESRITHNGTSIPIGFSETDDISDESVRQAFEAFRAELYSQIPGWLSDSENWEG